MNPWTPSLRAELLACIRVAPGSTNVQIAERMCHIMLAWPCQCKARVGPSDAHDKTWARSVQTCLGRYQGSLHMMTKDWRVEEIYPHLTRMRQKGLVHSIYATTPYGGRSSSQHWYLGPRIPDLADVDAVERWLTDSVDDDGLGEPPLQGLLVES